MCALFYLILLNAIKEDLPVADAIYSAIQPCWGSCLFELDHDMLTVLFGTRYMIWCEELVLSKPFCSGLVLSGLVLSAVVRWMLLPEHHQTKSFYVLTMCAVFYLILLNAIKEDLPVADAIYSAIQPCWGSCLFELDHDMLTVLFGTRNMVWCEELVLSKPLCSGLVLSAVVRCMLLPEHHHTKSF